MPRILLMGINLRADNNLMSRSIYKKVGLAAVIMMASVFLSRLLGLFRLMTIAYIGGRSAEVDAYQVAFVIPEILNHIVASGFLSITFIPIFSRYLSKNQEMQGWKVFSIIFTGFGGFLLIFIIIAHQLPQPWRGILDLGVVVGLSWGLISILVYSWIALTQEDFPHSPELPELLNSE